MYNTYIPVVNYIMEQSSETTSPKSPVVESIGKKVWESVVAIPVSKEWATKMRSVADQMTARKFSKARELLRNKADLIGKTAQVGAAVVDVAVAVLCGAGVVKFGKDMKNSVESQTQRIHDPQFRAINRGQSEVFTNRHAHAKKGAILFGGLGGAMFVVRPASRAAYFGAKWGGTAVERIAGVMNTIALRSEKQPL